MPENPPRPVSSDESGPVSPPSSESAESRGPEGDGPQPGTAVAEDILAAQRETLATERLAETRENLEVHAKNAAADASSTESAVQESKTPAVTHKKQGALGKAKNIVKGTGKNLLALFGLFGSWIAMAIKGAGAMAGKGGGGGHGGGHAKKDDHGGGHH